MTDTLRAIFARKPADLLDCCFGGPPERIEIQERREMTASEYDAFAHALSRSRDWLAGKGGIRAGRTLVVEVTAPDRKTIFINPEGGDWARYVGIAW